MPDTVPWQRRGAWPAHPGRSGLADGEAGVRLEPREGVGLATLIAADGREAELARAVSALGLSLPEPGRASLDGERALVWSGPGQWLAVALDPAGLARAVAGLAALTDQTDGRALVRVSGSGARAMLAKLLAIDLHPRAFGPGQAAVTALAHVSVQLWQRDDAPSYDIAVPRSFAGSLWDGLIEPAAEFGCEVA